MAKGFFSKQLIAIWRKGAAGLTSSRPPLSYRQAMDFFDRQAARNDLALGYPHEACFARNHLICEDALKEGFMPEKAWAIDENGKSTLKFTMPNGIDVSYWCHTAAALPVKPPAGEIIKLIFDPALLDGPATLQQWGSTINAAPYTLEIKRLGKPPTNYPGDYDTDLRTAKALADINNPRHPLQTIRLYQPHEIIPRVVFPSEYCRQEIFPALGQWPERRGNGWVSVDPFPQPKTRPNPHAGRDASKDEPKTGG